jgi:hypothetical protein
MKSWLCFLCFFFFCGFYYKFSFDHLHEYNNNVCACCSFTSAKVIVERPDIELLTRVLLKLAS